MKRFLEDIQDEFSEISSREHIDQVLNKLILVLATAVEKQEAGTLKRVVKILHNARSLREVL